ncbi:MAG: hypothetical protein ACREND_14100 [Gemmatimonadaceae bacterium]
MSDWLINFPVVWMAVVMLCFTYVVAVGIHRGRWRVVPLRFRPARRRACATVLITAHSRPFAGEISTSPAFMLQVMPESASAPARP